MDLLERSFTLYKIIMKDITKKDEILKSIGLTFEELESNAKKYLIMIDNTSNEEKSDKQLFSRKELFGILTEELDENNLINILEKFCAFDLKVLGQLKSYARSYICSVSKNTKITIIEQEKMEKNIFKNIELAKKIYKEKKKKLFLKQNFL